MGIDQTIVSKRTTRMLEDQFNFLYAKAVLNKIQEAAQTCCYGCKVGHLSQTQHSCIMLFPCQKLERYFEMIVQGINDMDILCVWNKFVETMDIETSQLDIYRRKIFCNQWRNSELKTDLWSNKLFKSVERMIKLEDRFSH